jgi:ribose 1,5-bisphosphokinase
MKQPTLFYVVGRSGVGKDTVLDQLRLLQGCTVAHRYITREATPGSENHIALSTAEFNARKAKGAFLLDWQAHGYQYGIGIEVKHWLDSGLSVFVNGSRHYLNVARKTLGERMISVLIDADDEICLQRLAKRGRENANAIQARMNRSAVEHGQFDWVIDNSGSLESTLGAFEERWQETDFRQGAQG